MQELKNKDESVANKLMRLAIASTEDNIKRYENLVGIGYKNPTRKLMSAYIESGISPDDKEQFKQFFRFYLSVDPDMTVHKAKIYSRLALNKKNFEIEIGRTNAIDMLLLKPEWAKGGLVLWGILTAVVLGVILGSFFLFPPLFPTVLLLAISGLAVATLVIGLFGLAMGNSEMMRMSGETNSIVKAETFINGNNLSNKTKAALKTLLAVREFRGGHTSNKLSSSLEEFQKLLEKHESEVFKDISLDETGDYLTNNATGERVTTKELLNRVYNAELAWLGISALDEDKQAEVRSAYHTALFEQGLGRKEAARVAYNVKEGKSIHEAIFESKPTFANWLASGYSAALLTIVSLPFLGIPAIIKFLSDRHEANEAKKAIKFVQDDRIPNRQLYEDPTFQEGDPDSGIEEDEEGEEEDKEEEEEEEEEEKSDSKNDSKNDDPLGLKQKPGQGK